MVILCILPSAWAQKPPDGLTYTCMRIVRDRAFNETIEKMCGYKGDVSERFKEAFKSRKCTSKVKPEDDERITREVFAQIMAQKNDIGLKDFCLVHRSAYQNL
ncbi:MAG: hypothetical protein EBQ82_11490 [Betaproteobacteria bacterium]|nr:hypothetical protein [Betaproteobacteria bacterium]NBY05984.1 hypothetical protein [Betaproteobacteria bacterium]